MIILTRVLYRLAGRTGSIWIFALLCVASLATAPRSYADPLRVLPAGESPGDARLGKLKNLDGYHPFNVPASKEAWEARAEELRRRVLVATGLWPMPERTPLRPVIHGRVERDGFTVDKVYFESVPNHFVTGLLFRPSQASGKLPVVLCPHRHGGRMQRHGDKRIREEIEAGRERFENCGRYPKLSRCVQLARMGCIAFIYDMIGYADSRQIPRGVAHAFHKRRPEFESKDAWGFHSTQAELRLQNVMGLQTWNSIRALDFLCGLPDADATRVGVTGGSGGGTQTILLCAIDPRPVVAFPQGMVSTAMQGGCPCENACLLRVGTGNVELAALFAPRPQAMTAANDWTQKMMTRGYPELRRVYAMFGAEEKVQCIEQRHFPHNYNYVTRRLMYHWFNKHLNLGLDEPVVEEHWKPLSDGEAAVWNKEHPRPQGGGDYERSLCRSLDRRSNRQMDALRPKDAASLRTYRDVVGGAFDTILGKAPGDFGKVECEEVAKRELEEFVLVKLVFSVPGTGAELPAIWLRPRGAVDEGRTAVWVSGRGKAGMFDGSKPRAAVGRLLEAGVSVLGADLLYQGEFLAGGETLTETRVASRREYAGYTFGYNHTVFAQRVHDVLAMIAWLRRDGRQAQGVLLAGVDGGGLVAAAARAQAGDAVEKAALDTEGFRFVELDSYRDPRFLPGAVKYGDVPALLALSAPHALWLAGEGGNVPAVVGAAYAAAGQPKGVTSRAVAEQDIPLAAADWLLGK
jgi:dienelactone hydrolase